MSSPQDDDDQPVDPTPWVAGLVGIGLGFLIGAAVFGGSEDPRTQFQNRLRSVLHAHGIQLLAAYFGQSPAIAAWALTIRLPNQQVHTVEASVDGNAPFTVETADNVASRVVAYASQAQAA